MDQCSRCRWFRVVRDSKNHTLSRNVGRCTHVVHNKKGWGFTKDGLECGHFDDVEGMRKEPVK